MQPTAGAAPLRRRWLADRGALALIALFVLLLPLSTPRISATDEVQYYVYLRSLYFDGDLNFANDYREFARQNPNAGIEALLQPNRIRPATGLYGNIAPVGSALLWAPFFLLADLLVRLARLLGAATPADGFSWPYLAAVCYGSALYGLAGVLLSYRLARRYVSAFAAALACATVWLASPLIFYMYVRMPFAHATGLFLTALFIWIWHETRAKPHTDSTTTLLGQQDPVTQNSKLKTQNFHSRPLRAWLLLGLVGGLMTITREQLGLFLLLPALEALGEYTRLLRGRAPLAAVAGLLGRHALFLLVFVAALTPQLAVYQTLNGVPRPAGEVSQKFTWCSSHWIDTLVDYDPAPSALCPIPDDPSAAFPPFAHGAFVWSPVLVPALLGLVLLWRRDRTLMLLLALAFVAQTYINGALGTTWHLTGSFGFRRLIECTPIFALGLGLLIERAGVRWGRGWVLLPALLFVLWNAGLLVNATVLHPELRREGLLWPELWRWQLEAPFQLVGKLRALLFDRCQFLENGC
ncbi:MAG: glycosyltransferase family 39 protein [Roseiflexaceae bacterium]